MEAEKAVLRTARIEAFLPEDGENALPELLGDEGIEDDESNSLLMLKRRDLVFVGMYRAQQCPADSYLLLDQTKGYDV